MWNSTAISRRRSLAGCACAALLMAAAPVLAQSRIGFVSLERILREAPAAQEAQKKLQERFGKRSDELAKQAEQLRKMQDELEKNAMTMPESERLKREREFGDANRDFQRKQREFNEDVAQQRKQEFESVIDRANRAVREIAEAEKLDAVFQNEQVVWASTRIDITEKVIKALGAPARK